MGRSSMFELLAPGPRYSIRLRPTDEQFEDARLGRWHSSTPKFGLERGEFELGVGVEVEPHLHGLLLAWHVQIIDPGSLGV